MNDHLKVTTKITNNTDTGPNYNGDWTTNPVVITGICSDTGGSECKTSPVTTYKNDIDQMIHYTEFVVDKADNKTPCDGYHQIKVIVQIIIIVIELKLPLWKILKLIMRLVEFK